jgi:hypothetical protein
MPSPTPEGAAPDPGSLPAITLVSSLRGSLRGRLRLSEQTTLLNRSQIVTGSQKHRDSRFTPYAFTGHGTVIAASVLNIAIAVQASIQVVRAFVRLREILTTQRDLARKLAEMENKYDAQSGPHSTPGAGVIRIEVSAS